jgi:UDP-N-acetylenolpyruvoylglucosamine reductase
MPVPWKSIVGSVAAGMVIAAIAIGCTWAYLASITIDDGLEGLIFLPLLGAAGVVVALAARTVTVRFRPVVASVATCVGVAVALTAREWSRSGGDPPIAETYATVVLVLFPLALCGIAIGTLVGDALRPRVRRAAR